MATRAWPARWARVLCVALLVSPSSGAKYLLFTTQRSGSTWFCDVLARQPGVECGLELPPKNVAIGYPTRKSEMMISYSFMKKRVVRGYNYGNITWAQWRADCEAQFAALSAAHTAAGDAKMALGFKLMYDQVRV